MKIIIKTLFLSFVIFQSCMPTRMIKPLKKGEKSVGAHFGGPMINFSGAPIPVPFTSITGATGIKDDLTAFGSIHTTSALFGVAQVDLGVLKQVYQSQDSTFGITTSPQLNLALDKWEGNFKLWPVLDINAYWHYKNGKDNFAYTGITNWFELSRLRAHGEKQPNFWLPAFNLGHQFTRTKMDYFVETKLMAPFNRNDETVVDYVKLTGNKGVFGIYFGLRKKF